MAKASATEWTERVRAWRSSGLTSKEFCRGRGFAAQTLLWWSSQLGRKRGPGAKTHKPRVVLARVVSKGSAHEAATRTAIRLELNGARVEVAPGTDPATLSMVLETLRAVPTGGAR
jgi:hypothetical protein